jgi:hypothetical protein
MFNISPIIIGYTLDDLAPYLRSFGIAYERPKSEKPRVEAEVDISERGAIEVKHHTADG